MRFLILAIILLAPGLLFAVEHSGTVRAADQFIPGATVTARQGGAKLVTYTDENGRYTLDLTPGVWDIEVSMFGFKTLTTPVTVQDQFTSRDWTLEMPRPGEVVEQPKAATEVKKPATAAAPATTAAATPKPAAPTPAATPAPAASTGRGGRQGRNGQGQATVQNQGQGRGARGRGQQQTTTQPAFQNADVTATDAGAQALAMAGNDTPPDMASADTSDAFMVIGSTSGGLGMASDEQQARMAMAGRGGRGGGIGGPGGPGGGGELGLMSLGQSLGGAGDPLGMAGFGAAGADGGFGADAGGGGFGLGGGRGGAGGGPGGGGGGGRGGAGGGGGGAGGGGRGGRGGGGAAGGRGGRGGRGPFNGQFATIGNRRGRGQQSPYQGSISINVTNSALNAAPYSLNGQNQPKPSSASEQFTGNFGGPIRVKNFITGDKWSFFVSVSNSDRRNANNQVNTVPTPAERAGDFSSTTQTVTVGGVKQVVPVVIYDPASGGLTPFPNNIIPMNRMNPASLGLLNYFPQPTYGDLTTYNYAISQSTPSTTSSVSLRLQGSVTRKDRLSFNEQYQHVGTTSEQLFGFDDHTKGYGLSSTAGWTHIFKPRFNNSASLSFSRNISQATPYFAYKTDVSGALGISGTDTTPIDYGPPSLGFTNFAGLSDGTANLSRTQTTNFTDTITYVAHRSHNLSFGIGYRRMQNNQLSFANSRGSFNFNGLLTTGLNPDGTKIANTGYDFADFLLGYPQTSSLRTGNSNNYFRGWAANAYANDDWRVNRGLTLNLGLRYEYFSPYTELFNHLAGLDINPSFTGVDLVTAGGTGMYYGKYPTSLVNPDPNNFSPRFGFAWRPSQKNSRLIRGGYSIFYSGSNYSGFATQMAAQPPFANVVKLTTTLENPLTVQNGFPASPNTLTNTYAINPNYKLAYTQTWTVALQQALPHNLLMEVEYVGIKGTGLPISLLPNQPLTPGLADSPVRIPDASAFTYVTDVASSIMHAGQVRLTRRFTRGISAVVLYTRSKSIDNDSNSAQNPYDLRLERALSNNDQRDKLAVTLTLSSPVGVRGLWRNGGMKTRLLSGWTNMWNFSYASGTPLTPSVGGNSSSTKYNLRPDVTGAPLYGEGSQFFNTAAFVAPELGYGDAGRNIITGVPSLSLNGQLNRAWRFGESRKQIQLSFRTQNALNHVYISGFGTTLGSNTFGLPTSASGTRTVSCNLRFNF